VLLLGRKGRAARAIRLRNVHGAFVVIGQFLLIIRELGVAFLQFLKFVAFALIARMLDQFAVFGCLGAMLLRFEHGGSFRWKSPRIPTNPDG
jgi:hypothetical protein